MRFFAALILGLNLLALPAWSLDIKTCVGQISNLAKDPPGRQSIDRSELNAIVADLTQLAVDFQTADAESPLSTVLSNTLQKKFKELDTILISIQATAQEKEDLFKKIKEDIRRAIQGDTEEKMVADAEEMKSRKEEEGLRRASFAAVDLTLGTGDFQYRGSHGVFSPDGKVLASFSDSTVSLFDVKTKTFNYGLNYVRDEPHRAIQKVQFDPSGQYLLVATKVMSESDKEHGSTFEIWDVKNKTLFHRLMVPVEDPQYITSLCYECAQFTPDGKMLLFPMEQGTLGLFDLATKKVVVKAKTSGFAGYFISAQISPNGLYIASHVGRTYPFGTHHIEYWELNSNLLKKRNIFGFKKSILSSRLKLKSKYKTSVDSFAFDSQSSQLYIKGADSSMTDKEKKELWGDETKYQKPRTWNLKSRKEISNHYQKIPDESDIPTSVPGDERILYSRSYDGVSIDFLFSKDLSHERFIVMDSDYKEILRIYMHNSEQMIHYAVSPDGVYVAAILRGNEENRWGGGTTLNKIKVWNLRTGQLISEKQLKSDKFYNRPDKVVWSQDSEHFIVESHGYSELFEKKLSL